jgi:isoleucyl-tRNA synthetase
VVKSEDGHTAALDPALDEDLRREGMARELVNRIQRLRKDSGLEITDRIRLGVFGPDPVREAADAWREFIAGETLALEVTVAPALDGGPWDGDREVDLDGVVAAVALRRVEG